MISFNPRRVLAFGTDTFDSSHRFETSWLISPWVLFVFRALFALFIFTVLIFNLIWLSLHPEISFPQTAAATLSFSYFTILTFWGLGFYFLFASLHTFTYAHRGRPLLASFPRPLQALHSLFYTTITTYPIVVTLTFWIILFSTWWAGDEYSQYTNISQHGLNSAFCLFEILVPRTDPSPWIHLLFVLIILAAYLGLAFITYATRGVWVYSFLDPKNGKGAQIGYIFGILAGVIVIFVIRQFVVMGRKWVTEKKWGKEGKFHGGRSECQEDSERQEDSESQEDVEFQTVKGWEK